jgi:hypothetical protein
VEHHVREMCNALRPEVTFSATFRVNTSLLHANDTTTHSLRCSRRGVHYIRSRSALVVLAPNRTRSGLFQSAACT